MILRNILELSARLISTESNQLCHILDIGKIYRSSMSNIAHKPFSSVHADPAVAWGKNSLALRLTPVSTINTTGGRWLQD